MIRKDRKSPDKVITTSQSEKKAENRSVKRDIKCSVTYFSVYWSRVHFNRRASQKVAIQSVSQSVCHPANQSVGVQKAAGAGHQSTAIPVQRLVCRCNVVCVFFITNVSASQFVLKVCRVCVASHFLITKGLICTTFVSETKIKPEDVKIKSLHWSSVQLKFKLIECHNLHRCSIKIVEMITGYRWGTVCQRKNKNLFRSIFWSHQNCDVKKWITSWISWNMGVSRPTWRKILRINKKYRMWLTIN